MNKYKIILYWSEEDNAYVAEVPDLPECNADGETYKQALENMEVARYMDRNRTIYEA